MEMKASSGGGRGGTGLGSVQLDDIPSRGFVGRLSPAIAAELIEGAPSVYYPPGSIIFSPGNGTTAALVVSGRLRYYLAGAGGPEPTIRYLGPGAPGRSLIPYGSALHPRAPSRRPAAVPHLQRASAQA